MKPHWKICVILLHAALLASLGAAVLHGQTGQNALRDQLRARYDVVALRDGIGLVPRQPNAAIRLIEIRNGAVAINGNTVSAAEVRQQLGQDADLVLRVTYLDAPAQRDLVDSSPATAPQAEPQAPTPSKTPTRRGDLVRFGGNVYVGRDEVIEGDVVAIGGSANVDGEVMQEVTVIGGTLSLGPTAVVHRNVTVVGGTLNRSPAARVYGKVDEVGVGERSRLGPRLERSLWLQRMFSGTGVLMTILRVILLMLSALVIVALGRRYVETIADRTATEPLRSGLAGLLVEILFVPLLVITIVVLAVSIIGIPFLLLVPFAIVLAVLAMLVGFTGVAFQIGRVITRRFGIAQGPYTSVILGVLALAGITLLARIIALAGGLVFGTIVAGPLTVVGFFIEYAAWTVGIGSVILAWMGMRQHRPPAAGSEIVGPAPGAAQAG